MLNAAQLAVFDMGGQNFTLMPRDTVRLGAANAARDALAGGARLIIGPLFAADVTAVKPVAQQAGVSVLALSTDTSLAEPGINVMGLAPAEQVRRVTDYALRQGMRRFGMMLPNSAYGRLVQSAFQQAVQAKGGQLVVTAPATAAGVQQLLAQRDKIEAVFVPLGGAELRTLATQLASAGLAPGQIQLLGTGLWDDPGIVSDNPLLQGGWYAAPDPALRANFRQNYAAAYGAEPPRLATLAYDATALAAILAERGSSYDRASLTNPGGFSGADGLFRFTPQGMAERGLAVLELGQGGSRIIDAAPASFASVN
jgi:ABC-type branched-subunit amino acid transport system substrate-binding protein